MSFLTGKLPLQQPPNFDITPASLLSETERILDSCRHVQDQIALSITPSTATFEKVLVPLADEENSKLDRLKIFIFLGSVSTDRQLRDASRKAEKLIAKAETEDLMREDIARLVAAVFERHQEQAGIGELDVESAYMLSRKHGEYIRHGLGIPLGPQRERYITALAELNEMLTAARESLSEVNDGVWFSRKDLVGVPATALATMKDSEEDPDKLLVTFRKPHFVALMQNATSAATRKRMFLAKENRFPENELRLEKIVALRDEIARLLGFRNHAMLKMEEMMAESVEDVERNLVELTRMLAPIAAAETKRMLRLKQRDISSRKSAMSSDNVSKMYFWDWSFYDRMLKKESYSVNSAKVAEYFEVMNTLKGMLRVFEKLFGMHFEQTEGSVWQEDVSVYTVWNDETEGGAFLGYLYFDLFAREGKYEGASHAMLQPGYTDRKRIRHSAASALICNFAKPTSFRPTLLRHNEVRTMFHELGHGIHNLVSCTRYSMPLSRDFIEIPSIMLENWIWVPEVLKDLGRHYSYISEQYSAFWKKGAEGQPEKDVVGEDLEIKAEERLPDRLIEELVRTKTVNGAIDMLKQVHLASFDLAIHTPSSHDAAMEMDITKMWNTMREDIVGLSGPDGADGCGKWGIGQTGFPHIFRKYDAGYFAYAMSKVCAADLFSSSFKEDPMSPIAGKRYRSAILEPGGGQPESETLKNFLGRKPSSEAYYAELSRSMSHVA